jgi:DNA-binding CsgD family transcriptional regulator
VGEKRIVGVATESLSKREQEVLAYLVEGERVATVAKALFLSPHTVRNHLRSIFAKLGVHSQPELLEYVREHPRLLGNATRLPTARTRDNLIREYEAADRVLTERIAKSFLQPPGAERLRTILHEALPLNAERAHEWRARIDLWCRLSDSSEFATVHQEHMDRRLALMKERIRDAQREGWLQPDLDPEELAEKLRSLVLSATVQILQDPSSQDSQLRIIDAFVDSLTAR